MKKNSNSIVLRDRKSLRMFLAASALAVALPSCITVPEKEHVYDYGDSEADVSVLPQSRPESYEGNPLGNFPQSR